MTMTTSHSAAEVSTERPGRYAKQLVAHLGRRNGGEWSDEDELGWIAFADGRAAVSCGAATLHLRVEGPVELLPRLEDVVGRHLVRFGARDELVVRWVRSDGTAGMEHRNTED
jgi:hypothetical protein